MFPMLILTTAMMTSLQVGIDNIPRFDCHPDRPEQEVTVSHQEETDREDIEINEPDETQWELGTASAYGGYGDDPIPNNQMTATGDVVTEYSYGVAVPMCWNTRENLGKTILIRYNGITVEGIINDVGGMGNGTRSLDLQPGIFKEFGADNCNEWGLRTVEYIILD